MKTATKTPPIPKGFFCACGKLNEFPIYVFAHWNDRLHGECEECKRDVVVCRGVTFPKNKRKTDTKEDFRPSYADRKENK